MCWDAGQVCRDDGLVGGRGWPENCRRLESYREETVGSDGWEEETGPRPFKEQPSLSGALTIRSHEVTTPPPKQGFDLKVN